MGQTTDRQTTFDCRGIAVRGYCKEHKRARFNYDGFIVWNQYQETGLTGGKMKTLRFVT